MNTFGWDRAVLLRGLCKARELNVSETDNILTPDSGSSRTVAKFIGNETAGRDFENSSVSTKIESRVCLV
jgi:hypothetical protein